ncbi:uncharacterized protein VTP21DRAFT_2668 [Calcarisporiella thermophila]|uniref:uncharacterized protein n=1 Tax=Calcarisporiella thermophila TaxID=911321 RepID=UPI0037446DCE
MEHTSDRPPGPSPTHADGSRWGSGEDDIFGRDFNNAQHRHHDDNNTNNNSIDNDVQFGDTSYTSPHSRHENDRFPMHRHVSSFGRRRTLGFHRGNSLFHPQDMELTQMVPFPAGRESISSFTSSIEGGSGHIADHEDEEDEPPSDYADTARLTENAQPLRHSPSGIQFDTSKLESGIEKERTPIRFSTHRQANRLNVVGTILQRASTRVVNLHNTEQKTTELERGTSMRKKHELKRQTKAVIYEKPAIEAPPYSEHAVDITSTTLTIPMLQGRSLCIFGPRNFFRVTLYHILHHKWTEPIILGIILLHAIVLSIDAWNTRQCKAQPQDEFSGFDQCRTLGWGSWLDWTLLIIYSIYSLEIFARIVVSGFIINPKPPTVAPIYVSPPDIVDNRNLNTHPRSQIHNSKELSPRKDSLARNANTIDQAVIASNSTSQIEIPRATAYLRHSFNRMDFLAVICYWVNLALVLTKTQTTDDHHIYLFQALAGLRLLRLLSITPGNATILQSLKKSAPLLANVAFFVGFFFVIFGIVGVQAFRGSLLRRCVVIGDNGEELQTLDQLCGGWLERTETGVVQAVSFIRNSTVPGVPGKPSPLWPKGYLCPVGQKCMERKNPHNGTISFDNIAESMLLVFVVAGVQNWTDIMYDIMDSEFGWACIYFIIIVIVMNFWLINLFVAVITEMFAKIRQDTSHSAFTSLKHTVVLSETGEGWAIRDDATREPSKFQKNFKKSEPFWVLLVFADLAAMGLKSYSMSAGGLYAIAMAELVFTLIFLLEIILRFISYMPNYRKFFRSKANCFDLFLAISTTIIQLPPIPQSPAYKYLTALQIARGYRIIVAIPLLRKLMWQAIGSVVGLANLVFFIILIHFITALIAIQLLRDVIPVMDEDGNPIEMRFYTFFNSVVALYQLFSGENWSDVLFNAMSYDAQWKNSAINAIFLVLWFGFSNFVLLNMFIAIILENFEIHEDAKRKAQIEAFIDQTSKARRSKNDPISRWNIFRYFAPKPKSLAVEGMPSSLILPMQKRYIRDFLTDHNPSEKKQPESYKLPSNYATWARVRRFFGFKDDDHVGFAALADRRGSTHFDVNQASAAHLLSAFGSSDPSKDNSEYFTSAANRTELLRDDMRERNAQKEEFITQHPMYDVSLFIFRPSNPIRRFCQRLVPPSYGDRTFGVPPHPVASTAFTLFIFLSVVVNVAITAVNTPMLQRKYMLEGRGHEYIFYRLDTLFTAIFTIEFLIRVIADGFLFTPNAYLYNAWNGLDFFVLFTLYVNLLGNLTSSTGLSRAFRAFKALRALRLINLAPAIKKTFYAILVAGLPRIASAAALSLCLIVPFALYGQNLFMGLFYQCNDNFNNQVPDISSCVGEFLQSLPNDNKALTPRVWSNPYHYSFDSFGSALLILFEIVSGEGWIDVETTSMGIRGSGLTQGIDTSQANAIFFMVFNLAGAVFVLNLFLGVVIENFTRRSGTAFLTADQRQWIDLKKLLRQIRPAKRPKVRPVGRFRSWCYDRAADKRGWLSKIMTVVCVLNIITLMSEYRTEPEWSNRLKEYLYLTYTFFYIAEILIKLIGLGWESFRQNSWNLYDVVVVTGAAATTYGMLHPNQSTAVMEAQKLFLTAICFKLVQKSDSLNQLFKIVAASAPEIFNLFAVWFVVLTVYAIMFVEIFGLTRYGSEAKNEHINFRNFGNALLMLVRFSTGEDWNRVMHDYTVEVPFCVNDPENYLNSDCGSTAWTYFLFLSFNIISMYIFTAMFVVVVLDNFSYCYQIASSFSLINRDEIRNFKRAWATIDTERTGYIQKKDFVRFFRLLSGSFDVRIYGDEYSVKRLVRDCSTPRAAMESQHFVVDRRMRLEQPEIDWRRLSAKLNELDQRTLHERRHLFNYLYQEAVCSEEQGKGISFTNMLLMLAHYKLVDDGKSLLVDEILRRKQKLERVEDLVNLDRVRGLLRTLFTRRKFQKMLALRRQRLTAQPARAGHEGYEGDVPRIVIGSQSQLAEPSTSRPRPSLQLSNYSGSDREYSPGPASPTSPSSPLYSPSFSPGASPYASSMEAHHIGSLFGGSPNLSYRSSAEYSSGSAEQNEAPSSWQPSAYAQLHDGTDRELDENTAEQVVGMLDNHYWNDMLREAASQRKD